MKAFLVALACAIQILPGAVVKAEPPVASALREMPARRETSPVWDVQLGRNGSLQGLVVDAAGAPAAYAVVAVRSGQRELGRAETDGLGRFAIGPLGGGAYQLQVGRHVQRVRLWVDQTAPPNAKEMVLVVLGGDVVRGQLPLAEFFASDRFVIAGMVAAAIAIPIAVHSRGRPTSPP